jgi:serine phosphatase RsbU (regulator of sigma subunit)
LKSRLVKLFRLTDLDEEERLKRVILLRILLLTAFFGTVWGVFYLFLGLTIPGLVPIIYALLSMINLSQFFFNNRYHVFRFIQLILILLLPFCMQLALGSFMNASAVILASILCPLGALMFHTVRVAKILFYLFISLVIIAGGLEILSPLDAIHLNTSVSVIFFVSNIVVICSIIFVLLEFFVAKKNHIQNLLVQKNKDITDSITYAKRIQQAILPTDKFVKDLLPESFVLYKPKDIVSGDFYWVAQWGNHLLFAAVDCTGHGVPGAFMSIVGQNLLNQAVNEHGLTKPNLVLNALNKGVSRTLGKNEDSQIKDGMDIALCALDKKRMILEFAGAYNPLWLLRNNEIIEIKGNKFPIGSFIDNSIQNFTNNEIQLQSGDILYIFTDGYADQFGGEKGKKFKYKNIKKILLENRNETMDRQKEILDKTLEKWKGDLEQLDDILFMGVKI